MPEYCVSAGLGKCVLQASFKKANIISPLTKYCKKDVRMDIDSGKQEQ